MSSEKEDAAIETGAAQAQCEMRCAMNLLKFNAQNHRTQWRYIRFMQKLPRALFKMLCKLAGSEHYASCVWLNGRNGTQCSTSSHALNIHTINTNAPSSDQWQFNPWHGCRTQSLKSGTESCFKNPSTTPSANSSVLTLRSLNELANLHQT